MVEEGLGLDVAGGGEIVTALRAGVDPMMVVLHGNAKGDEEIAMAVEHGLGLVVVDGADDLDRLEAALPAGATQDVLVRVIPGVEADTHASILTGHAGSKFGVSPERAREPLHAVQQTGRQAVAELSRMLGLLRGSEASRDDARSLDRAPQPGAAQLPELAERMSASGVPVDLVVSGQPRSLPAGIELTAYRIVQEALTNTLKHGGPGVTAHVAVRYLPHTLEVEINDDGHNARSPGSGHGLIGMIERAGIYGGTIETGIRSDGGFRAHLALPLDAP